MKSSPSPNSTRLPTQPRRDAFTRVDLLAVTTGVALLGTLAIPTIAGFRSDGDAQVYLGNHRQLLRAWLMYAEDNEGRLPGNLDGGEAQNVANTNRTWAVGRLDNSSFRPDNTNTTILKNAQLGRYLESVSVFRCPADTSLSRGRTGEPRVRSVSMNGYLGERPLGWTAGYRQFTTLQAILEPSPAKCFVFIDEREDSINDPWYIVDMSSFDPDRPSSRIMVDYPADWHDGGATLGFVDGHVESWRWVDPRTRPLIRFGQLLPLGIGSPNNPDVRRLQAASSSKF